MLNVNYDKIVPILAAFQINVEAQNLMLHIPRKKALVSHVNLTILPIKVTLTMKKNFGCDSVDQTIVSRSCCTS